MLVVVRGADTIARFDIVPALVEHIDRGESPSADGSEPVVVPADNGDSPAVEISGGRGTVTGRMILLSVSGAYARDSAGAVLPDEIGVENLTFSLLLGNLSAGETGTATP